MSKSKKNLSFHLREAERFVEEFEGDLEPELLEVWLDKIEALREELEIVDGV